MSDFMQGAVLATFVLSVFHLFLMRKEMARRHELENELRYRRYHR